MTLNQRNDLRAHEKFKESRHHNSYGSPKRREQRISRSPGSTQDNITIPRSKNSTPTRAERRAVRFGHKENPPEGYKGLPNKSPQQRQWARHNRDDNHKRPPFDSPKSPERRTFNDFVDSPSARDKHSWADARRRSEHLNHSTEQSENVSDERTQRKSHAPLSIPYTTPASEFLYGHSVVTMALRASRRIFYKLYLYNGDTAEVRGQDKQVRKLALAANVEVTRVGNDWIKLMDKMSGGRPHNGYILEASPLPKQPVTGLKAVQNLRSTSFGLILDHQSREEEAINGTNTSVSYGTGYQRYPFLLLLDGIVSAMPTDTAFTAIYQVLTRLQKDPGNLGAIIRSSHFLGVDGILICNRNSAALTPVALKAATGAAETLPLYSVNQPASFIDECQENGWKVYAAVSPSSTDRVRATGRPYYSTANLSDPTQKHPCILILGSEGDGLRWNIQKKADYEVGIEAQRSDLDSLNVSVASALLSDAFLRGSIMAGKAQTNRRKAVADAFEADKARQDVDLRTGDQDGESSVAAGDQRLF
ncbi:MAG: hypothetical protein Q9182_002395 [Xanthomendoza sp. 2 TL-2023]